MLSTIGLTSLSQLFSHIQPNLLFPQPLELPNELSYFDVVGEIAQISDLSNPTTISFIGDQLPQWNLSKIIEFVSNLEIYPLPTPHINPKEVKELSSRIGFINVPWQPLLDLRLSTLLCMTDLLLSLKR